MTKSLFHLPLPKALIAFALPFILSPVAHAQADYVNPYTFTTLAGTPYNPVGVDATGSAARFLAAYAVTVDSSGNVYVADAGTNTIRKVTPGGVVTTLAGQAGVFGSADGTGTSAQFNGPVGIAIDSNGNLFVADNGNQTIRKVTQAGVVTTFAGSTGKTGSVDGTGSAATFGGPFGIGVDGSNNVYVSDEISDVIRKITPAGVVTTIAGQVGVAGSADGPGTGARFNEPYGLTADSAGNVYVADSINNTVRKITPAGVVSTLAGSLNRFGSVDGTGNAAEFYYPVALSIDSSGNLYVSDYNNNTIRKVTQAGVVTTLAGRVGVDGYVDGTGSQAEFDEPWGSAVDSSGNIYLADLNNDEIRKITAGGTSSTLAGTPYSGHADGSGAAAQFYTPTSVAVDASGNTYVADEYNDVIRKITPAGVVTTFAGTPGSDGSADGTGAAAQFNFPFGVAVDGAGNVYVADAGNNTVRKITPAGVVTTLAGTAGTNGSIDATGAAASFSEPLCVALDSSGNVYVSEQKNNDIRKITPGGAVTTLAGTAGVTGSADGTGAAAKFDLPVGLAVDSSGNVYVADATNDEIRKITPGGVVTTLAGSPQAAGNTDGTGSNARFFYPSGLTVDPSGNLYLADQSNYEVRKITPAGVVTTLGGTASTRGSTDGTGRAALFNYPDGIAIDSVGNLYVADTDNEVIRKGTLSGAPQITSQPTEQFVASGGSATFSVTASGSSAVSYQWNLNGSPISGATNSSYTVTNAQTSDQGTYSVTVTDADGSVTSSGAALNVGGSSGSARLTNISTRAVVGTGASILIPGFYISGSGTETLLIRGDGPSLGSIFGVSGSLAQPSLSVYSGSTVVASNTGWTTSSNSAQITSVSAQVGAFAFPPGSADCAVIVTLNPGAYTVQVSGVGGTTGVGLAEIYEVSYTGTAQISNISTRATVGTGANLLIPGFYISGSGAMQLLVRGDGPALGTTFGISGSLAQPSISVYSGSTVVASNTGWTTGTDASDIASVSASVGAFAFVAASADSATIVNLSAGAYTVQLSGVGGTTGVGLAEIYVIP